MVHIKCGIDAGLCVFNPQQNICYSFVVCDFQTHIKHTFHVNERFYDKMEKELCFQKNEAHEVNGQINENMKILSTVN